LNLIDRANQLSIREQCRLMGIARSAIYYENRINETDPVFTNLISELWLEMPSNGYRKITRELQRQGYCINHKRVLRLMREAKIQAMYPRPNTSMRNEQHAVYPYLLNGLEINRPNQVWATDITYLKAKNGWMYLVAMIDLYSRRIISWRLSNTMDASFCLEMLEEALTYGKPEIINTDQGTQFTCDAWIKMVQGNGITVSMDGKGRWADNIIIERFWRTLKHENLLLHVFDTVAQLKESIGIFIYKYNYRRLHQSLNYKTPMEIYTGIEHASILVLGKKKEKQEAVDSILIKSASGGGLLSSPFLGGNYTQAQLVKNI
jgi:putative transposase